jgi:hypothetical protein
MKGLAARTLKALALVVITVLLVVPPALAGTSMTDRWAYNVLHPDRGVYGELDAWAYNVVHASPPVRLVTEHSVGQNANVRPVAGVTQVTLEQVEARGFSFRDAGIGAAVAFAAILVAIASLAAHRRRVLQPLA